MSDRLNEFSDPRKIVVASKKLLREKCRALSGAELKYDSFLMFPEDELKISTLTFSNLPSWWHLVHLYLRIFAWAKSEIRCRVGAEELDAVWELMNPQGRKEYDELDREVVLDTLVQAALWERDDEGALWSYDLCRDYIARTWLTATEILESLSEIIDESRGEPLDDV